MSNPLEREFRYYLDNQTELVERYSGKILVIKDQKVAGVYETEAEALFETAKVFPLGTFLIQRCSPGKADYTQHFQTRVAFG